MKETRCEVCSEEAVIRYQLLNGKIIDICYECFKYLIEERNDILDKPKRKIKGKK